MKILEIILDNRHGGISQRALAAAEGMAARGLSTHFLLPEGPGAVHEAAAARGVVVHRAFMPRPNPAKPLRSLLWMLMIPVNTLQIRRIIRRHGIDAIHVNGLLNVPGFLAARLCSVPLIWHLAATSMYPMWLVRLLRPLLKRATVVVCIAEAVRDYFLGKDCGAYRYRIVHEPVDAKPSGRPGQPPLRESFGIAPQARLVVTVANVSPRKGILYAIQAIDRLAREHPDVHYLVVGELMDSQAEYRALLDREINARSLQGRVTFAGGRADVCDILKEADVFLLPSLSEGTPISILEAMSMEIPVVATDVGGIPEQIEDGTSGLLVKPRDPEAIAAALDRFLRDPAFAKSCAGKAHETVCREFSLERFLDEFERLLATYVAGPRPS